MRPVGEELFEQTKGTAGTNWCVCARECLMKEAPASSSKPGDTSGTREEGAPRKVLNAEECGLHLRALGGIE